MARHAISDFLITSPVPNHYSTQCPYSKPRCATVDILTPVVRTDVLFLAAKMLKSHIKTLLDLNTIKLYIVNYTVVQKAPRNIHKFMHNLFSIPAQGRTNEPQTTHA